MSSSAEGSARPSVSVTSTVADVLLGRVRALMRSEYATLWLPAQGRHLSYHWDGARVDQIQDLASGKVFAVA